jgi:chromosome segregation ATPase
MLKNYEEENKELHSSFDPIKKENTVLAEKKVKLENELSSIRTEHETYKNEYNFIQQDRSIMQQQLKNLKAQYKKLFNTFTTIKKYIPNQTALKDLIQQKHLYRQKMEQVMFALNDPLLQRTNKHSGSKLTIEEEKVLRSELEKLRVNQVEKTRTLNEMKRNNEILGTELNRLRKKHETVLIELEKNKVMREQLQEKEKQFNESKLGQELINRVKKAEEIATEYETLAYSYKKALNEELKKQNELQQELKFLKIERKDHDLEQRLVELKDIVRELTERLQAKEVEIKSAKDVNKMLMQKIEEHKKP